ncbi:MAG: helix-hairpin-helix domain-containing protein [Chromatiales bacterium]|nr:helix-hairpin-helix domain-containing protein [Chromatiales bacterium]
MHAEKTYPEVNRAPEIALQGNCGYEVQGDRVRVTVAQIANNRDIGNLSGTLALELWALQQPYEGGDFSGIALAGTTVGEVSGQHYFADGFYDLLFSAPPAGTWHMALMLREWTPLGYVTRDHINFALPYQVNDRPEVVRSETDNVISLRFQPKEKADSDEANADAPERIEKQAIAEEKHEAAKFAAEQSSLPSVNYSSQKELAAVKGVSKKVADRIVHARPFASVDDLLRVKGIGNKFLQKIRNLISL